MKPPDGVPEQAEGADEQGSDVNVDGAVRVKRDSWFSSTSGFLGKYGPLVESHT